MKYLKGTKKLADIHNHPDPLRTIIAELDKRLNTAIRWLKMVEMSYPNDPVLGRTIKKLERPLE